MYSLNIHLLSFKLNPAIFDQNDYIRVSITTVPEDEKQAYTLKAQYIYKTNHFFTVNVTNRTKKIIFVFRKMDPKEENPIIASTIVHSDEFPKQNNSKNTEIKRFNIFEPLCKITNPGKERRIFGEMLIQMFPGETTNVPVFDDSYKTNANYIKHACSHHKKRPFRVDENQNVILDKKYVFN